MFQQLHRKKDEEKVQQLQCELGEEHRPLQRFTLQEIRADRQKMHEHFESFRIFSR